MIIENLTQTQKTLLNGVDSTKTYIRKSDCTSGNAYRVTLTRNGVKVGFIFNDNIYNESDKNDFIYSLLSDSQAYESTRDLTDFMNEYGYTDAKQAKQAYNACKKQFDRLHKLFNNTEIETLEKIFENYWQ